MKKVVLAVIAAAVLSSCTLYFGGPNSGDSEAAVAPASLFGGGMLSDTNANDISPFMYRALDGNDYLFFASDRKNVEGDYDIWYARKIGTQFDDPVRLEGVSTSGKAERSPVVFTSGRAVYIAYISMASGVSNVIVSQLSLEGMNFTDSGAHSNATIEYSYDITNAVDLGCYNDGTNEYLSVELNDNMRVSGVFLSGNFDVYNPCDIPVQDCTGFDTFWYKLSYTYGGMIPKNTEIQIYLYGNKTGGYEQIASCDFQFLYENPFSPGEYIGTNFAIDLSAYSSAVLKCNDRDPFVDMNDGGKLYFASDRNGNGKYDLWRYNIDTFSKVAFGDTTGVVTNVPSIPLSLAPGVYVSAEFGAYYNPEDLTMGLTPDHPVNSIDGALTAAANRGLTNIYVDNSGSYSTLYMSGLTNLNVYGGFDPLFAKRTGYTLMGGSTTLDTCGGVKLDGFAWTYEGDFSDSPVFIYQSSRCLLTNCLLSGVTLYGTSSTCGMITLSAGSMSNRIMGCALLNNTNGSSMSASSGGVLIMGGSCYNTVDSVIFGNYAYNGGGVTIYGLGNDCYSNVIGGSITYNSALQCGGGVCINAASENTVDAAVVFNTAGSISACDGCGGGIYLFNACCNVITGDVLHNTAFTYSDGSCGGGIYLEGSSLTNTLDCDIGYNSAARGGGVFVDSYAGVNTILNVVEWNTAVNGNGGGIYLYSCADNILNAHITHNTASQWGGGFYVDPDASGNIIENLIDYNTAILGGGGYFNGSQANNTCTATANNNSIGDIYGT